MYTKGNGRMTREMELVKNKNIIGKQEYANGDKYEGEWKDDKRNGNGKCLHSNQEHCIITTMINSVVSGMMEQLEIKVKIKFNIGIYYYDNGNRYEGELKNGEKSGNGKHIN